LTQHNILGSYTVITDSYIGTFTTIRHGAHVAYTYASQCVSN